LSVDELKLITKQFPSPVEENPCEDDQIEEEALVLINFRDLSVNLGLHKDSYNYLTFKRRNIFNKMREQSKYGALEIRQKKQLVDRLRGIIEK